MAPRRKLTGAQATLITELCLNYMNDAEMSCMDTPAHVPIFSGLSMQQRLKLVSEVMIGLVCLKEPLPPNTIQHNATMRALIHYLFDLLEVELEEQCANEYFAKDLIVTEDSPAQHSRTRRTPELDRNRALVERQAERNREKLEQGKNFTDEFKAPNESGDDSDVDIRLNDTMDALFGGEPISKETRKSMRPLSEDEQHSFRFRILCDKAFQEDPVLSMVNFDFRCQNLNKWQGALNFLLDTFLLEYSSKTEKLLINGLITQRTYADKAQLPRINAVRKQITLLRQVYEAAWKPELNALDERAMYAVGSRSGYCSAPHKEWTVAFIRECRSRNINISSPGKYQERLQIFREMMPPLYMDGLDKSFCNGSDFELPSEYENGFDMFHITCSGPNREDPNFAELGCFETENLMLCSRCKVVRYCSAECQRSDWKRHKRDCKILAARRKDKEEITEIARARLM